LFSGESKKIKSKWLDEVIQSFTCYELKKQILLRYNSKTIEASKYNELEFTMTDDDFLTNKFNLYQTAMITCIMKVS